MMCRTLKQLINRTIRLPRPLYVTQQCFHRAPVSCFPRHDNASSHSKKLTASQCVLRLSKTFTRNGVSEPMASAEYIVAHACGYRTMKKANPNHVVTSDIMNSIRKMAKKRLDHQPIQYILGEWDFRELVLAMKPPAFIPRPETEELVELILRQPEVWKARRFLEVGCGSGAISLALLNQLKKCQAVAVDQSQEACDLTSHNASLVGVEGRLEVHRLSFSKDSQVASGSRFDFAVSNPPYIPQRDMLNLQPEINRYEDLAALDGGVDGLDLVHVILEQSQHLLTPGGSLWLEIDPSHPVLIQDHVARHPYLGLKYINTHTDFLNRARFCHLQYLPSEGDTAES